jgi:hypothetical protein
MTAFGSSTSEDIPGHEVHVKALLTRIRGDRHALQILHTNTSSASGRKAKGTRMRFAIGEDEDVLHEVPLSSNIGTEI